MQPTEADVCLEKPFANVLSRRHDQTIKRAGLHGKTGRKLCGCASCRSRLEPSLERTQNAVTAGNTLVREYLLTDFELEGLDTHQSLDRNCAWDLVPNLLHKASILKPTSRKLMQGGVETCFALEPTAIILPDPAAAANEHRLATHIYKIHRGRPKLEDIVPTQPPPSISKPKLKLLLRSNNRVSGSRSSKLPAQVHCNHPDAFWDVNFWENRSKPIDQAKLLIDLGRNSLIHAFSTQGRHPATRHYPSHGYDSTLGRHCCEDEEKVAEYTDHVLGNSYKGPYWRVRTSGTPQATLTRGTTKRPQDNHAYHPPAWVSRYELHFRVDGGRAWHSLGSFQGNVDEISEKVHFFETLGSRGQPGLLARYLRVLPLECTGGGAMRVGVYGEALESTEGEAEMKELTPDPLYTSSEDEASLPTGADAYRRGSYHSPIAAKSIGEAAAPSQSLVKYTLTTHSSAKSGSRTKARCRYTVDGQGLGGGNYGRWKETSKAMTRSQLKLIAASDANEEVGQWENGAEEEEKDVLMQSLSHESMSGRPRSEAALGDWFPRGLLRDLEASSAPSVFMAPHTQLRSTQLPVSELVLSLGSAPASVCPSDIHTSDSFDSSGRMLLLNASEDEGRGEGGSEERDSVASTSSLGATLEGWSSASEADGDELGEWLLVSHPI